MLSRLLQPAKSALHRCTLRPPTSTAFSSGRPRSGCRPSPWHLLENAACWLLWLVAPLTACGSDVASETNAALGCEVGTQGCTCYGNWSCNYQLSCVEQRCVDRRNEQSTKAADTSKLMALQAADPIASAATASCGACLDERCLPSLSACYAETACAELYNCLTICEGMERSVAAGCTELCYADAPIVAHGPSTSLLACARTKCSADCETTRQGLGADASPLP